MHLLLLKFYQIQFQRPLNGSMSPESGNKLICLRSPLRPGRWRNLYNVTLSYTLRQRKYKSMVWVTLRTPTKCIVTQSYRYDGSKILEQKFEYLYSSLENWTSRSWIRWMYDTFTRLSVVSSFCVFLECKKVAAEDSFVYVKNVSFVPFAVVTCFVLIFWFADGVLST